MSFTEYLNLQILEALGPENKWYASQEKGYEVTDAELLFRYYVKHGGASHFAQTHHYEIEIKTKSN